MSEFNSDIKKGLIILVVGTIAAVIITLLQFGLNYFSRPVIEEKPIKPIYSVYDITRGEHIDSNIKNIDITSVCSKNGCIDHPVINNLLSISQKYKVTGEFSKMYLYVKAFVDYDKPLTSWDSLYFKIDNTGGHLDQYNEFKLPVPESDIGGYLYDLKLTSPNNFFGTIINERNINAIVGVASARKGRILKEAKIYYECFQDSDCSITSAQ